MVIERSIEVQGPRLQRSICGYFCQKIPWTEKHGNIFPSNHHSWQKLICSPSNFLLKWRTLGKKKLLPTYRSRRKKKQKGGELGDVQEVPGKQTKSISRSWRSRNFKEERLKKLGEEKREKNLREGHKSLHHRHYFSWVLQFG